MGDGQSQADVPAFRGLCPRRGTGLRVHPMAVGKDRRDLRFSEGRDPVGSAQRDRYTQRDRCTGSIECRYCKKS